MQIDYKNKKIEKICTNRAEAEKKHGIEMAKKIHQRISEISSIETVEQMIQFRLGRCHKLKGDRKEQYAVDLIHPYRLVFYKKGDEIQIAEIKEIIDYH